MTLSFDACYDAFASKDRRFDGRFFCGVTTTGIYCRPGCPAKLPRRENVAFYPTAAAAETAGLRACLRCRPDASPDTPAWIGSLATVSRALRLLSEGGDAALPMPELADRLGVGERHLRRLFAQHVGASPAAVARTRRVHFARKLLEETSLPITDVALAAGFSSLRRFHATMKETFARTPTELRKEREHTPQEVIELRLSYRPPLDRVALLRFLAGRASRGVEHVDHESYARTLELDGAPAAMELRFAPSSPHVILRVTGAPGGRALFTIAERARRIFDLGADPDTIEPHLRADPRLAPIVARHPGLRVPGVWDPFELAVRAVLGQQVSVAAATTLASRLVALAGSPLATPFSPGLTHLFPAPRALAAADLRSIGVTSARAETLRRLAEEAERDPSLFHPAADLDGFVARLSSLPGIGPWTASYVAMRALGEPDAFPTGDRALANALGLPRERDLLARAEAFRPWRAYATMLLWTDLTDQETNP